MVVNAGHPRPLWFSASARRWHALHAGSARAGDGAPEDSGGLPLGVLERTDYGQFDLALSRGDIVVLYTDSMTEAASPAGELLGEEGLLGVARGLDPDVPEDILPRLMAGVREWTGKAEFEDDATMIVLHHNAGEPPPQSLGDRLAALTRLIGL